VRPAHVREAYSIRSRKGESLHVDYYDNYQDSLEAATLLSAAQLRNIVVHRYDGSVASVVIPGTAASRTGSSDRRSR
jgi:hypothetical protein